MSSVSCSDYYMFFLGSGRFFEIIFFGGSLIVFEVGRYLCSLFRIVQENEIGVFSWVGLVFLFWIVGFVYKLIKLVFVYSDAVFFVLQRMIIVFIFVLCFMAVLRGYQRYRICFRLRREQVIRLDFGRWIFEFFFFCFISLKGRVRFLDLVWRQNFVWFEGRSFWKVLFLFIVGFREGFCLFQVQGICFQGFRFGLSCWLGFRYQVLSIYRSFLGR